MSYLFVWIFQLAIVLTMSKLGWVAMTLHEVVAGAWFSASALLTHWVCRRIRAEKGSAG